MSNINELKPTINLNPFARFCCTIGNLPSSYMASLTYEEQLMWLCDYLQNTVIPAVNNNAEVVKELQELYVKLKNYVDNYFENLDVQNEINTKLDEMAQDGTLDSILNKYISKTVKRTYLNNDELINDNSLQENMIVNSLSKKFLGDGGGGLYIISSTKPQNLPIATNNENLDNFYLTLSNNLFAIPVNNINNNYYDEITNVKERHLDTDCYFTTIPLLDNNNQQIDLYIKNNSGENISDYARNHNTTVSINATLGVDNPETHTNDNASVISDGVVIREFMNPPNFLEDHYKFIAIKDNREFVDFQANNTTVQQMLAQNVKQAWLCFGKLVDNGVITDYAKDSQDDIMSKFYPRQAIGVKLDKTVVILTCDGRTIQDRGLTGQETAQLLIEKGCVNVWNLDGGGSTNTIFKGSRINKFIDNNGLDERHIVYCLNAKKPTSNKNIDNVNSFIGTIKDNIIKQLLPTIPRMLVKNPANLNELITTTNMYSCYNSSNYPNRCGKLRLFNRYTYCI